MQVQSKSKQFDRIKCIQMVTTERHAQVPEFTKYWRLRAYPRAVIVMLNAIEFQQERVRPVAFIEGNEGHQRLVLCVLMCFKVCESSSHCRDQCWHRQESETVACQRVCDTSRSEAAYKKRSLRSTRRAGMSPLTKMKHNYGEQLM